jgi:hypothetical protein
MMTDITVVCDRCGKTVEGLHTDADTENNIPGGTSGYYTVDLPSAWVLYANLGEKIVCDECMWSDPRYIADYGKGGE